MNIQINGYPFKVELVEQDSPKMNPGEERYYMGLTEYFENLISIRKGMNERMTRATVIHELIHAYIFAFGYHLEEEEAICNFFGSQGDAIISLADEIMRKGVDGGGSD